MYTRLDDVPVFERRTAELDAHYYNDVQVALNRLGETIRFPIPKLKHLDLILEKEAWIIVDRAFNDVPVAAWSDFQVQHRNSLHEPIECQIRLFHANANLILEQTLEVMMDLLREQLLEEGRG